VSARINDCTEKRGRRRREKKRGGGEKRKKGRRKKRGEELGRVASIPFVIRYKHYGKLIP